MEISLSSELKEKVPGFKVGIIFYDNMVVDESPQMIRGRLQTFQESLFFDLEEKPVTDIKGVDEWRKVFKQVGTDPNRYRPSVEALYRRVKKQNYINTIHSAADLNNFFSLQYEVPIGIYDADKLQGSIQIRIGNDEDKYVGINGRELSMKDKIVSSDDAGPFGSPYVDSDRSAVTFDTVLAIQIVYLKPSMSSVESEKLLRSLSKMFVQVHGGTAKEMVYE